VLLGGGRTTCFRTKLTVTIAATKTRKMDDDNDDMHALNDGKLISIPFVISTYLTFHFEMYCTTASRRNLAYNVSTINGQHANMTIEYDEK
jgi:hypothetical protein